MASPVPSLRALQTHSLSLNSKQNCASFGNLYFEDTHQISTNSNNNNNNNSTNIIHTRQSLEQLSKLNSGIVTDEVAVGHKFTNNHVIDVKIKPMPGQDAASVGGHHQTRSLVSASSPLASSNFDINYASGMSSDSELTCTTGSTARHNHHRSPYSSQSRIYYAHPVPRNSPASSRLSHYSDSIAAASMQPNSSAAPSQTGSTGPYNSLPPSNIQQQQQQQRTSQQQQQQPPLGHQGSVSSSGSASSSYLAGIMATSESPISPIMMGHQQQQQQQTRPTTGSGRQLPQRPFKQSISIDHHHQQQHQLHQHQQQNLAYNTPSESARYYSGHLSDQSSPAHNHLVALSSSPRKTTMINSPDQQLIHQHHQYQQQQQQQQQSYQNSTSLRQADLDMLDKQTANMSLYESGNISDQQTNPIGLPPTGMLPRPSSSASVTRQLPNIGQHHYSQQHHPHGSLMGAMSLDQHHSNLHQMDTYHQQQQQQQQHNSQSNRQLLHHSQLHHQPTDPYSGSSAPPSQQTSSSSADSWMPPSAADMQNHYGRNQFKQTMSIDYYQGSINANRQHQQQQHYPSSRTANLTSGDQSHQSVVGSYSATGTLQNQQQQQQQQQKALVDTGYSSSIYYPHQSSLAQHQINTSDQHHNTTSQQHSSHPLTSLDSAPPPQSRANQIGSYERSGSSSSAPVSASFAATSQQQTLSNQIARKNKQPIQHQMSDSSSNSNLSGSLKTGHGVVEGNFYDDHTTTASTTKSEHQKSMSSAGNSAAHHQQQLAQHKMSSSSAGGGGSSGPSSHHQHHQHNPHHYSHGRQDILRRGYTSVAMTASGSGGGGAFSDLGGSQSALSDAGDLSLSQASHSGAGTSSKRYGLHRAASPTPALEGATSQHHHHSHSGGHGSGPSGIRSESSTGLPNGSGNNSTLTKKSNSATQLSMTGTKKRLGFRKKQVTSFSVHRSEEVAPLEARHLVKQGSSVSEGDSSMSGDSSSRSWSNSNFKQQTSEELASMSFIEGLGKGQMISRQGLTSPYLGDIQLSLCDRRGNLEVEVIRARGLSAKTNKIQPLTYVKLYLVKNRKCLAKAKTTLSNKRTLNPLFQQQLTFHEDYHGCILQSIVWGNFGKMDKKNFMGIAQISIDDLELSDTVISWYKLFLPSSLQTLPSKSLRHTLLSNSTESFTNNS